MTSLHWAHPWAFLFGAGCLLAPAWRMVRARRLIAGADDYADKALRPWAVIARPLRQRWPRSIAEVLVWLLLATAMAGPRERLVQSLHGVMQSVHAVNIMVVLDTSAGMYLRRSPAPLAVEARSDLLTLQQLLRGERLGLVVYGRASGEIVPPTDDPALFDYYLDHVGPDLALTTWRPDVAAAIPRDSGLAGALYLARHALRRMPGRSDAILLIAGTAPAPRTDASDLAALRRLGRTLRTDHIPVFVRALQSRSLDLTALRLLARQTGGRLVTGQDGWTALYRNGIARLKSNRPPVDAQSSWYDLFTWPLIPALILMAVLAWPRRLNKAGHVAKLLVLALVVFLPMWAKAGARSDLRRAWQSWLAHDDRRAASLYAIVPGWAARMGEGDSLYRLGNYAAARAAFQSAMLMSDTDSERAEALFNLGNAAFHLPGLLREAIAAYRASAVLRPGNAADLHNLAVARLQWRFEQRHAASEPPGDGQGGGTNSGGNGFTESGDDRPSRMGKPVNKLKRHSEGTETLAGEGHLATRMVAGRTDALLPPPQDIAAALRKIALLHDQRIPVIASLLRADNRDAANVLGQSR
jgi:Ca-activated chloride channel family protein